MSVTINGVEIPPIDAIRAALAATTAPPPVADSSASGTADKFALADHTHRSSVQSTRMTVGNLTNGSAKVDWVFTNPFPDGKIPDCVATCEVASGAALPLVVNLIAGSVTNTGASFIVFKSQTTTLGSTLATLINMIISPFVAAPSGAVINAIARLPSVNT